jgi:hypothetical protein
MRCLIAGSLVAVLCALTPAALAAPAAYGPWDGKRPFPCKVQDVGTGTDFPDPGADPFCVKFDKTHQNVTELGIADFLLKEPARVAAAVNKCQYFQKDHWTGRIVDSKPGTEIYNFRGRYFFDKSSGAGGVYVKRLRILGRPVDFSKQPGVPPEFGQYFSKGGGGAKIDFQLPETPFCSAGAATAKAASAGTAADDPTDPSYQPDDLYTTPTPPAGGGAACVKVAKKVGTKGIGAVTLGQRTGDVKKALGTPGKAAADYYRYCTKKPAGKRLLVGLDGRRVVFVGTNSERTKYKDIGADAKLSKARKKLKGEKDRGKLIVVKQGKAQIVLATKGKLVESIGVADSKLSFSLLKKFANQAG